MISGPITFVTCDECGHEIELAYTGSDILEHLDALNWVVDEDYNDICPNCVLDLNAQ
jgi:hypothetical protein